MTNNQNRTKATGPDEVTNDIFKEMDPENTTTLLELLNQWLVEEFIEEEILLAKVVLIFQKRRLGKFRKLQTNLTIKQFL